MIARTVRLVAIVVAAGLGSTARADQFHFSAPDAPAEAARIVEGVLLQETDDGLYVIRVEGGELRVPKALVTKIESDGLTVAQLERRETDAREALARADADRQAAQAAMRMRRDAMREAAAAEASARRSDSEVGEVAVVEAGDVVGYDPVLHRLVTTESVFESEIRRQLGGEIRRYVQRELRDDRRALRRALRRIR